MKKHLVSKRIGLIILLAILMLPLGLLLVVFNSPPLQLRLLEQMKPLAKSYGIDLLSSPKHLDLRGKIEWPDFNLTYKHDGTKVAVKASSLQLVYSIDWWGRKIHFSNIEVTAAILEANLAVTDDDLHKDSLPAEDANVFDLDSLPISLDRAVLDFKTINIQMKAPTGKAETIQLSDIEASLTGPSGREQNRHSLFLKTEAKENIIDAFGVVLQPSFAIEAELSEIKGTIVLDASLKDLLWPEHLQDKINLQVTLKGVTSDEGKSATVDYTVKSDKTDIIKAQLQVGSKIESQGTIELSDKLLRQVSTLAPLRPYAHSYSLPYSLTLTPQQKPSELNDLLDYLTEKAALKLSIEPLARWTKEYAAIDQYLADLKINLQTNYSSEGIKGLEASVLANTKKQPQKLGQLTVRTKIDNLSQLAATFNGELLGKKGDLLASLKGSLFDREGQLNLQWNSDIRAAALPLSIEQLPVRAFNVNSSFVADHRVASISEITDWSQVPVSAELNISVSQTNPVSSLTLDPLSQLRLKVDGNFEEIKWKLASKLTGAAAQDFKFKGVSLLGTGGLNLDNLNYSAKMEVNEGQLQILNQPPLDLKMRVNARGRPELSQIENIDFTLGKDLLKLTATGQVGPGDSQLEGTLHADIKKGDLNLSGSELYGSLKLPFYISAIDNKDYTFDGTVIFENVSLKNESVTIQSATGTLPVAERLIATERGFSFPTLKVRTPFERVDFPSLQSLISKKGVLKIEKITFEDKVIAPLYLVSNLQQNLISLNRFFLQAGPSMIDGEAHINLLPSNFQFSLLTRLEDVRFSDVLPKSMVGGNSLSKDPLSGRAGLLIDLNNSTVDGRVDLSHIKRSQIFNLLELVDPKHKDSQLQSLRSVLSAGATPRSLTLSLAEGLMNIRSEFPIINSIEIKSVPVSGIVQSSLEPLNKALREVPLNENSTSTTASP